MYQIVIVDENAEVPLPGARSNHQFRVPQIGEHMLVKWKGQTKVCEVEDVWTHVNLDGQQPYQGAVQVLVRWAKGIDPQLYIRRFKR